MSIENTPLVSICCLAYNQESYIKQCIEGFLIQETSFPIEILIHDDASTDKTANIIREFEVKYPKLIKPIYQANNQYGRGVRINATIQFPRAKGKYIAMCEGDDYWTDPYKLQKQVDELNKNPKINICSHSVIKYDDILKTDIGIAGDNGMKKRIIPIDEVIGRFGVVAPMASIMIRNKNTKDYSKLVSNGVYGGHGIMQVLWTHPKGLLYIPENMSTYRANSEGSVTKNILNKKKYFFKVLVKRIESFKLLDLYFKQEYKSFFLNKTLEVKKDILRARQISLKDKINFLRQKKINLNIISIILLVTRSLLSKIKHQLIK